MLMHRLWRWTGPVLLLLFLPLLAAGCSDEKDSQTPMPRAEVDREQVSSFDELVDRADIIAEVTASGPVGAYWDSQELLVATRFALEIQDVLKGDVKPGDSILAHVPGGEVRATSEAHGSRKPVQGGDVVLSEDTVSPFYLEGRKELVFLEFVGELPGIGPIYFDLGWGSRYRVDGGSLFVAEPKAGNPGEPPVFADDWRGVLHGRPLAEAKAQIRAQLQAAP